MGQRYWIWGWVAHGRVKMAGGVMIFLATTSALAQDAAGVRSTDDADSSGSVHVGVRTGYGIAFGKIQGASTRTVGSMTVTARDVDVNDFYVGMIPIWIDVGIFATQDLMLGLYGHYGVGLIADPERPRDPGCPPSTDCSGSVVRVGIHGQYHLSRGQALDPWFGVGFGYERASVTLNSAGGEVTATMSGVEFVNFQAGVDFEVAPRVAIGPFVSFSLGQYSSLSYAPIQGDFPDDIPSKALHEWLVFGVHSAFGF
jgi:hypothetical protein